MADDQSSLPDPSSWKKKYEEWIALLGALAGSITTIIVTLVTVINGSLDATGQRLAQMIGFVLAAAIIGGGVYLWFRIKKKKEEAKRGGDGVPTTTAERTKAFRGLFSYQATDDLPGVARGSEAGTLFTQILSRRFPFWVISGDTGCGKSSLLAAGIQSRLLKEGVALELVVGPRSLRAAAAPTATDPVGLDELTSDLNALQARVKACARRAGKQAKYVVLLIDQFEEFFVDYPFAPQRELLGSRLAALITGKPNVVIVCAVRKDYVPDLLDLAPAISEPLQTATTTYLKNFTVEEAADVVRECAKRDGAIIDPNFANRVAADLSTGGFVRPPELQIVCTALRGVLTLDSYAKAGGATGILSEYVRKALVGCRDKTLARRLLRELCNFPQRVKEKPQTFTQLRDMLRAATPTAAPHLEVNLKQAVDHLTKAWLIGTEGNAAERQYTLAQDYLVDAIALATRDVTSRAEEAKLLTEFFFNQPPPTTPRWTLLPTPIIPWEQLRFIYKNADRSVLDRTDFATFLRRARRQHYVRLGGQIFAVGAVVLGLAVFLTSAATFEHSWHLREVGRHFPEGRRGTITFQTLRQNDEDIVLTKSISYPPGFRRRYDSPLAESPRIHGLVSFPDDPERAPVAAITVPPGVGPSYGMPRGESKEYLRLWGASDGKLRGGTSGRFLKSATDDVLLERSDSLPAMLQWRSLEDLSHQPPRAKRTLHNLPSNALLSSDSWGPGHTDQLAWFDGRFQSTRLPQDIHVYSLSGDKEIGVCRIDASTIVSASFLDDKKMLIMKSTLKGESTDELLLWDFAANPPGESKPLYPTRNPLTYRVAADPASLSWALLIVEQANPTRPANPLDRPNDQNVGKAKLVYQSARGANKDVLLESPRRYIRAYVLLAPGGEYVVLSQYVNEKRAFAWEVRDTIDLGRSDKFPYTLENTTPSVQLLLTRSGLWMAWQSGADAKLWKLKADQVPITLKGLDLTLPGLTLALDDRNGGLLAVVSGSKHVALWNLAHPEKPAVEVTIPGGIYTLGFTLGDKAFFVGTEGGGLTVFRTTDGKPLAELHGLGGDHFVVYYSEKQNRLNVWTSEGRVLCYHYTWEVWFSHWFRQSASPDDSPAPDDEPSEPWEDRPSVSGFGAPVAGQ